MTNQARARLFGLPRGEVQVAACWSGYRLGGGTGAYDAPPPGTYDIGGTTVVYTDTESVFAQCQIDGHDPTTDPNSIGCAAGLGTTDQASALSEAPGRPVANTVTAYACYIWRPPMAGFLLLPQQVTLRAVITEAIQRQQ
jgi:hypothetical protein